MLFSDLYSEVQPRFVNWVGNSNTGNANIPDIALDYLNRAQFSLAQEAPRGWVYLTQDHVALALAPSTTDNQGLEYYLPADIGVLLTIYVDTTLTHKPTIYYSRNGKIMFGFRFIPNFTKAAGFQSTVKFFYTPINVPYCRYQVQLPKFTGTGTEYCPFPGDLLLLEAQKIRCAEKGLTAEWQMLKGAYEDYLAKFKGKNQNVSDQMQPEINDSFGNPLVIPEFGLASGMKSRQIMGRRNDMDVTRY
jgi:hypothetical protein